MCSSRGDEFTGVIDWSEAARGDALYDLAILTPMKVEIADGSLHDKALRCAVSIIHNGFVEPRRPSATRHQNRRPRWFMSGQARSRSSSDEGDLAVARVAYSGSPETIGTAFAIAPQLVPGHVVDRWAKAIHIDETDGGPPDDAKFQRVRDDKAARACWLTLSLYRTSTLVAVAEGSPVPSTLVKGASVRCESIAAMRQTADIVHDRLKTPIRT